VDHCVLEWLQEVLLEHEMGQLFLLQETHSQLAQGIESKEADMSVRMTADLDCPE